MATFDDQDDYICHGQLAGCGTKFRSDERIEFVGVRPGPPGITCPNCGALVRVKFIQQGTEFALQYNTVVKTLTPPSGP